MKQVLPALKELGTFRDSLLLLATGVYALGYVVWAINSWRLGLGLPPALDAQYIAAGIIPFALIGVVWLTYQCRERIRLPTIGRGIVWATYGVAVVGTVFALVLIRSKPECGAKLFIASFAILYVAILMIPLTLKKDGKPDRGSQVAFYGGLVVTMVGALYVLAAFLQIPTAFGGLRPRCAELDVFVERMSGETVALLGLESERLQPHPVVRTDRVDVLMTTQNALFVRALSDDKDKSIEVLELNRESIGSVQWCSR